MSTSPPASGSSSPTSWPRHEQREPAMRETACDDCLRRTDLVAALAGWLDVEWRKRDAPGRVLARSDESLLDVCDSPRARARYDAFDADAARARVRDAGLAAICRCDDGYPSCL